MVVYLLRNDLGIVARDVKVDSFRYIDKIEAGKKDKELLVKASENKN